MNTPIPTQPRRRQQGFTLIELLVAIAILGILGSVGIQALFGYIDESRQLTSKEKADSVFIQCQMYKRKWGGFPEDLNVLTQPDARNNNQPYLNPEDLLDGWNNQLEIIDGELAGSIEIVSRGANAQEDSFDDLALGFDRDLSSGRPLMPAEQ